MKPLPSPDLIRDLLIFDPDTGKLFWRERSDQMFAAGRYTARATALTWNKRNAGREAFTAINDRGYLVGSIQARTLRAHRVAWCIASGAWPENDIDHINGITTDNRLENLRAVSHAENGRNQRMPSHNRSGRVGVFWHASSCRWRASIKINGRERYIGAFEQFDRAVEARSLAESQLKFHENHGRR